MEKVRRHITLSKECDKLILKLMDEESIDRSPLIERAIMFYLKHSSDEVKELKNILTSINKNLDVLKLIANINDRDNKIMLEFWNHYFLNNDFKMLGSTERHKTDELIEAEGLIAKRIAKNRQRKLDAQN